MMKANVPDEGFSTATESFRADLAYDEALLFSRVAPLQTRVLRRSFPPSSDAA